jgi:uncharacterized phiE125 gp8 family phage protein
MSLVRTSIDRKTLSNGLLPSLKAHSRITFDEDDTVATKKIAMAIDRFEKINELAVCRATWTWTPETAASEVEPYGWLIPVRHVSAFTAGDTTGDISSQFVLGGVASPDNAGPQYLSTTSSYSSPLSLVLTVGYEDVADLPPGIEDVILRLAATLYEYREMDRIPGVDGGALSNSFVSGYWTPRC